MRIVCPQCQAAYKVDLPDLDESGMEVKCAKCQNIFPVKKEGATPQDSAASSPANGPSAKDLSPASEDQDNTKEIPLAEEYLEDMMDEFVQQESTQKTPAQPSESNSPDAGKNVGSLIDDIIQKEPGAQKAESGSREIPFTDQEISEKSDSLEDPVLDDMWEKAVRAGSQKLAKSSDVERGGSDALADQEEIESRWKEVQEQDKAMAEKDLLLAEEHERSLDEQWSRALSSQGTAKSSLEEVLKKDLKDSSPSGESPPTQPKKAKTPEPQTTPATDAAKIETDDSFDDDWMRALATQTTTEKDPPPEKLEKEPAADSAAPIELEPETESKTKEPPTADPVSVPKTTEPVAAEVERPEEPASGAVVESADEFNTDELWEQAFTEPETPKPVAAVEEDLQIPDQAVDEKEDDPRPAPIIMGQDQADLLFNADEALKNYDESAYADDDDDLFDYQPKKRSRGPLGIPSGRKGDWIIAGFVVSLLFIVGGIYFAVETFAPKELTDIQVADAPVPEGLTPHRNSAEFPAEEPEENITASQTTGQQSGTPPGATTSDTANSQFLATGGDQTLITEMAKSKILGDSELNRFPQANRFDDVLASGSNFVTMSTIMPVAYNSTDIRVLSFSLEMQMSDAASARRVRDALPIYEKIMIQTVEDFLKRKFYDDVLYVREKLQKRLLVAMNQSIQGGRVKKTKFTDFAIQ